VTRAAEGPNLISNGTFDSSIAGWDLGTSPQGHGILTWDSDAQAAAVTYQQTSLLVNLWPINTTPVTVGTSYRASAKAPRLGLPRPTISVYWRNSWGDIIGVDTSPPADDGLPVVDAVAPADATEARLCITPAADRAAGAGDRYLVDDVAFRTYTPDPPPVDEPVTLPTVADLAEYLGIEVADEPGLESAVAYAVAAQATLCDVTTYTEALHYAALRRGARWLAARGAPLGVAAGEYGAAPLYRWDAEIEAAEAPYRVGTWIG
jgi:hypothetical protein